MQTNIFLRQHAKDCGVHLWQLAERVGLQDYAFSRKLRHELPEAEREKLIRVVDQIRAEREVET